MLQPTIPALLALLLVPAATPGIAAPDGEGQDSGRARLVIHVPRMTITETMTITRGYPANVPRPPLPVPLVERGNTDCVKMETIRSFAVNRADSVDLQLRDGKLLRLKLGNDCPALGFYNGFYVKANPDKKMCAGRDSIRSRSGRLCSVDAIHKLVAAR